MAICVRLSPEIMYEEYAVDDYMPSLMPGEATSVTRPIHGIVVPREGIVLSAPEIVRKGATEPHAGAGHLARSPGQAREALPWRVAGWGLADRFGANSDGRRPPRRPPREVPRETSDPAEPQEAPPRTVQEAPVATPPAPSLTPSRAPLALPEVNECSADAQQARFADCEHQCGRALELSACLFDFRKCHIAARGSAQPQKERDACDLTWEQCLFKANVAPGSGVAASKAASRRMSRPPVATAASPASAAFRALVASAGLSVRAGCG